MRKTFNRIPFNIKLILSTGIPLVVLIFAFFFIREERRVRNETTNNFIKRLEITMASNKLTNCIQMERRFRISKLAQRNSNQDVERYRAEVDQSIQYLTQLTTTETSHERENSFGDDLGVWRALIDSAQISTRNVLDNYQLMVDQLRSDNPTIKGRSEAKMMASSTLSYMINLLTQLRLDVYVSAIDEGELDNSFQQTYKLFRSLEAEVLNSNDTMITNEYLELREESGLQPMLASLNELVVNGATRTNYS